MQELLQPPPTMPLVKLRAHILRMSGLSTTAIKVLRICNEPDVCANRLNRVISLDPVLTGRVLQLVNSAYYSLPSKVSSLTRAFILLGINTVKNLVLTFAIFESFSTRDCFRVFSADEFWAHSLSTAAAARLIATHRGVPAAEREEYFVAGLMHDIGKIPLNHLYPEAYRQAVAVASDSGQGICYGEEMSIGIDHCGVGQMIARKWQLSESMSTALSGHHAPAGEMRPEGIDLVDVVAQADALAHSLGAGMAGGVRPEEHRNEGRSPSGESRADEYKALLEAVAAEVEKARLFLEIAQFR